MHFLRKLLREIHRRSVWQTCGVYFAISWVVLESVEALIALAHLPTWPRTAAVVLLAIGLPLVIITAVVQRGVPAMRGEYRDEVNPADLVGLTPDDVHVAPEQHPLHREHVFTWRNVILGGVCAGAVFTAAVLAYVALRASGLGAMLGAGGP